MWKGLDFLHEVHVKLVWMLPGIVHFMGEKRVHQGPCQELWVMLCAERAGRTCFGHCRAPLRVSTSNTKLCCVTRAVCTAVFLLRV